jgi:pimeloyl-ACP methyl ester carboxylesterase
MRMLKSDTHTQHARAAERSAAILARRSHSSVARGTHGRGARSGDASDVCHESVRRVVLIDATTKRDATMNSTKPKEREPRPPLAYARSGSGETLVLLHGLGSSRQAWRPVIPLLSDHFDVIAIDLPGFGDSASLPSHVEPHPGAIAAAVVETLNLLGVESPHVAGNSLGGWVALELAARIPVDSISLFSPAGLWHGRTPLYDRISLTMLRAIARFGAPILRPLAHFKTARWIMFRQIVDRPTSMSAHKHARRSATWAAHPASGPRCAPHYPGPMSRAARSKHPCRSPSARATCSSCRGRHATSINSRPRPWWCPCAAPVTYP